jgi:hypothetical protein
MARYKDYDYSDRYGLEFGRTGSDWGIGYCAMKDIMKRWTLCQGLQKLLITENNFLFLIPQKKRSSRNNFFYRLASK